MRMFFAIVLSIWAAMNAYVFWRISTVPWVTRHLSRGSLIAVAVVLWAAFPLSHMVEFSHSRVVTQIMESLGTYWLGTVFLLLISFLAADVITGFGFFFPKSVPIVRTCALITAGILAAIAIVQGLRAPVVSSYEVRLANLPPEREGTVVVVASDIHLSAMTTTSWVAQIVDQINAQRPDMIILAGDTVEGQGDASARFSPILRKLSARDGVWAVNGNHEGYGRPGSNSASLESLFQGAGIRVLRDEWAEISPGLIISGVDDLTALRRKPQSALALIDRALAGRPAGATVYVSHTPDLAERAAGYGVGLMVSGHTHNGQIWPFNYIVGRVYPLIAGRYDVNGMSVFVCRGTGTWGPRMRLWQRSEILRITLRAPQAGKSSLSAITH